MQKKLYIILPLSIILILVMVSGFQSCIKCAIHENDKNDEEDILSIENFGTKEPQYKAAAGKFEENSKYFIELQTYYDSIKYQSILTEQVLMSGEVEIEGNSYSLDLSDETVKLFKLKGTEDSPYGRLEDEIKQCIGYFQDITIWVDRVSGKLEMIQIDVTNPDETEKVVLVWSREKMPDQYAYGMMELSEENWILIFYGAI